MSDACCRDCRGVAPHHFCINKPVDHLQPGCHCHQKQDAIARTKRNTFYRDPTYDTAMRNMKKGNK